MAAWFEGMFGADFGVLGMWTTILLAAALALLVVYWLIRRTMSGTFVVGGRSRKPRLAVLDAAAVDSRRRIVLVRRDDTEHLILIGGPTDIVIEQGIHSDTQAAGVAVTKPEKPPKVISKTTKPVAAPEPKVAVADARQVSPDGIKRIPEKPVERAAEVSTPPAVPREPIVPARRLPTSDGVQLTRARRRSLTRSRPNAPQASILRHLWRTRSPLSDMHRQQQPRIHSHPLRK